MKIGLALSGGGVRALVFHLGVLKRLAEGPGWNEISFVSTVSGGSLCVALVFEKAGQVWPSADTYLKRCLPAIRSTLTTYDLEDEYKHILFREPWRFLTGRASLIAELISQNWGIRGNVNQMPESPRWEICCTCYETGKNWRFSRKRMGDYLTNYVVTPEFPLAEAAAASAAVPGVIGPLHLKAKKFQWHRYPENGNEPTEPVKPIASRLTLWDGGVYENLGIEAIYKPQGGLRDGVDFMLVSDASKPLGIEKRRFQSKLPWYLPPFRLIDIATDQVRAYRLRTISNYLQSSPKAGCIVRMGNSTRWIFKQAKKPLPTEPKYSATLTDEAVALCSGLETTLRKLSEPEYDRLLQHGYEVCEATLRAYDHQGF
jgi:NTE family protein